MTVQIACRPWGIFIWKLYLGVNTSKTKISFSLRQFLHPSFPRIYIRWTPNGAGGALSDLLTTIPKAQSSVGHIVGAQIWVDGQMGETPISPFCPTRGSSLILSFPVTHQGWHTFHQIFSLHLFASLVWWWVKWDWAYENAWLSHTTPYIFRVIIPFDFCFSGACWRSSLSHNTSDRWNWLVFQGFPSDHPHVSSKGYLLRLCGVFVIPLP